MKNIIIEVGKIKKGGLSEKVEKEIKRPYSKCKGKEAIN